MSGSRLNSLASVLPLVACLQSVDSLIIVSVNISTHQMRRYQPMAFIRAASSVALTLSFATRVFASVTLNVSAGNLNDASGNPMPTNGLVLLIASTNDSTFGAPTPDTFVAGDDIIIAKWDLSTWSTPGLLLDSTGPVTLEGGWNAGDPLQLCWFPTLTITATAPGAGAPYGQYRTNSNIDDGDPWITPADGATITLKFLTTDAGGLVNPPAAGNASFVVGGIAAPKILSLTWETAASVVITWSAVSNRSYRVQYRSDLGAPWSDMVPDVLATNNIASAVDSNADGQAQRFYRVQLLQ